MNSCPVLRQLWFLVHIYLYVCPTVCLICLNLRRLCSYNFPLSYWISNLCAVCRIFMLLFLVWSYRHCASVECRLYTECHRLLFYFLQRTLLTDFLCSEVMCYIERHIIPVITYKLLRLGLSPGVSFPIKNITNRRFCSSVFTEYVLWFHPTQPCTLWN